MEDKPILSIETSEKICGVCLYNNEENYTEISDFVKYSHSEKIFGFIEQVFISARSTLDQIGAIAVSSGPGSFTGLRIGMSVAKGLALGASKPIIPVPTFEAMAFQLSRELADNTSFIIANKVNSEELYFARFQIKGNNYIFAENLSIIKHSDLDKKSGKDPVFGNFSDNSGNNAARGFAAPSARYVAGWARVFGNNLLTYDYDLMEPEYLKELIIKGMRK